MKIECIIVCLLSLGVACTSHHRSQTDATVDVNDDLSDAIPDQVDVSDIIDIVDAADISDIFEDVVTDVPSDVSDADASVEVLEDNTLPDWHWNAMVQVTSDRTTLNDFFAASGYAPPAGTYLVAALAQPGLGQLAFSFFSRGNDGFVWSSGVYWPASTVKVLAAVGAIQKMVSVGCGVNANVTFTDDDGFYDGTVANLVDLAIRVSDNVAYNRLMEIGGFEEINHDLLHARFGMPQLVLQRRYTHPTPQSNFAVLTANFIRTGNRFRNSSGTYRYQCVSRMS